MPTQEEIRKYREDTLRCARLRELLYRRIESLGMTRKNLASRLEKETGLTFTTASVFVNSLLNPKGNPERILSSAANLRHRGEKRADYLSRLASFYKVLEIESNNQEVLLMSEINPNFRYPLNP
jgi:hypothetical protein